MNKAKFPESLSEHLWTECANTATDIDNIFVSDKTFPIKLSMGVFPNVSRNSKFR
jgi:hypothetical protein